MADENVEVPLSQRIGIDRTSIDYSSTLIPWLLEEKFNKRIRRKRHRDIPLDHNRVLPLFCYSSFSNNFNGVCNHLAHAGSNRNKFPNTCVRWFPNGKTLLGSTLGGKFIMWNGTTFQFEDIKRFPVSSGSVTCLEWSPRGDFIIAGDEYGKLALLSPALSLLDARLFEGLNKPILDISISPNGNKLCSCADTYAPHIWDINQRNLEGTLNVEHIDSTSTMCMKWHQSRSLVITGSKNSMVTLWDPLNRVNVASLHGHKVAVNRMAINPDGNNFITSSIDGMVKLWDIRMLRSIILYNINESGNSGLDESKIGYVCCMTWNPVQRNIFAVGDNKSRLLQYNTLVSGALSEISVSQVGDVKDTTMMSMDWHPLGHLLATCSDDKIIRFWSRGMPGSIKKKVVSVQQFDRLFNKVEHECLKYFPVSRWEGSV